MGKEMGEEGEIRVKNGCNVFRSVLLFTCKILYLYET